jgi:hypothetical protein
MLSTERYAAVRAAAEALATSASRDTWTLADAVLKAVPERRNGRNSGGTPAVSDLLREMADRLAADGVTGARGEPYAQGTLDWLREVALAWPVATRLPSCAFNTHATAKGAERQAALRKLAAYAEGQPAADVAERIRERIDNRVARGARYLVSVDDLRLVLGQAPTRADAEAPAPPATPAQLAEALLDRDRLAEATEQLDDDQAHQAFVNVNAATAFRPTQDPELADVRREVREQRERQRSQPSAYDLDVAQARLAGDAAKAVRRLLHSFAEHRPEPDGLAVQAVEHLRGLVDQLAVLLATPDAIEEGIRRLLAEEGR